RLREDAHVPGLQVQEPAGGDALRLWAQLHRRVALMPPELQTPGAVAPRTSDPFEILGMEPRFDLDLRALEQRHRDLSRALHPDRYAGAPSAERRLALSRAIEVNDAWRMLRDPIRRAEAILRRGGVEIGETLEPKPSPDLLMEMMESREALSDAARKKDLAAVTA